MREIFARYCRPPRSFLQLRPLAVLRSPRVAPPQHGAASQRRIEKAGYNGRALESLGKPSFERKPGEISDTLAAAYAATADRALRLALGEEDDR